MMDYGLFRFRRFEYGVESGGEMEIKLEMLWKMG
jgi:hypothetical protein